MSYTFGLSPNTRLSARIVNVTAEANSIYPTLRLEIEFSNFGPTQAFLSDFTGRLFLRTDTQFYVGAISTDLPLLRLDNGASLSIGFYTTIDFYGLAQIERLRGNRDLTLGANIAFSAAIPGQPLQSSQINVTNRTPKSDWVETLLTAFQYKQVFLL